MSENTKRLGDIDEVVTMSNDDKFVIIVNSQEWLISKANLQKVFTGLSSDDYAKINKIVIDGNGVKFLNDKGEYADITTLFNQDQFVKNAGGLIELSGYHTHSNQENILDKFTVDDSGTLLFNGELINSYTLPTASTDNLGGVKVDGSTITIDENGVIHGANTYILPTASNTVLGGVKVDNDTIKINEGVISADVIGNWSAGTNYPVGYFVVYDNKLYECTSANSDTSWNGEHWQLIGDSSSGTTINNWSASTDYVIGDLIINETTLYQCNTEHTSGETFDETESVNWTVLSGEKGDKGYSPVASVTQTDTGCTITIIDANGTTTSNLSNGTNGKDGASPTIDPTTKNWIVGTVDTGVKAKAQSNYFYTGTEFPTSDLIDGDLYLSFAEGTRGNVYQYQESTLDWSLQGNLYGGGAVIDDTSTVGNTVTWSANKINSVVEDINTAIENIDNSGSGVSGGSIVITDSLPQSPDTNTLYKYTDINLGDLLMMYSNGHWRYSPLLMYPQKVFISPTEIYATGHVFGTTPSDAISVVDLAEPVQVNNLIATQALKIYGQNVNNINYGWTFNFNVPSDITLGERYLYIGVSTEQNCDYANVIVNNGTEKSYHSGSSIIGKYAIPLDTLVNGENSITVKYIKDGSSYKLDDCIYIYGVDYLYTM